MFRDVSILSKDAHPVRSMHALCIPVVHALPTEILKRWSALPVYRSYMYNEAVYSCMYVISSPVVALVDETSGLERP